MKILAVLLLVTTSVFANETTLPIRYVIDGDTVAVTLPLPSPLNNGSVRVYGIDTPEKGTLAKCPQEAALALKASALTKSIVGTNKEVVVQDFKWDKYGGRIVGKAIVNGISIGDELLKANLAYPYYGGAKRSWCK